MGRWKRVFVWALVVFALGAGRESYGDAAPHVSDEIIQMNRRRRKRRQRVRKQRQRVRKQRSLGCPVSKRKGRKSRVCRRFAKKGLSGERFAVVLGRQKKMYLCRGKRLLRRYPIGHGRKGFGKQREGDKKTPLGSYRISWMAARHEPRRGGLMEKKMQRYQIRDRRAYCWQDPKTGVSIFRRDRGPRDERLWRRPYGGKRATVMGLDYPNAVDRKAGKTGSCIEIHASYHLNGSAGCVTLWPKHAMEFYGCVRPGTRVEIRH